MRPVRLGQVWAGNGLSGAKNGQRVTHINFRDRIEDSVPLPFVKSLGESKNPGQYFTNSETPGRAREATTAKQYSQRWRVGVGEGWMERNAYMEVK